MLNILSAICLWLAVTTCGAIWCLPQQDDGAATNVLVVSLLFFNNLNILIAMCEIVLGLYISDIQSDYQRFEEKYSSRNKEMDGVMAFLTLSFPNNNPFNARAWSQMWSTYALYDPSYQNNESFGFFIDVGNGLTTIPPCLLWNYAMIACSGYKRNDSNGLVVSPLLVGCFGIATYWQILYGTVIYFVSFFYNKRYQGRSWVEVAGFVGFTNSLWFFFPILGIYASVMMLRDGDFSVFR